MDDKFLCGLCLGMIGGAVIVANSNKARKAVTETQEQIIQKIEDLNTKNKSKNQNS